MPGPQKRYVPSKEELLRVYPKMNIENAAKEFGVGQTLFHKWLKERGIPRTKAPRAPRSEEHKRKIGMAKLGVSQKKPESFVFCATCGKSIYRRLSARLAATENYCSQTCANTGKTIEFEQKVCPQCRCSFARTKNQTAQNFRRQIFCSFQCSAKANPPPTFEGENHPNWKGEAARRRNRRGPTNSWRNAVLSRDKATCQHCGTKNGTLVVHHIKPFETFPELRFEVSNGLTLCQPCHFKVHGYSLNRAGIIEETDERGVLTRRWVGRCMNCDETIVRRASDMARKNGTTRDYAFCSRKCASKTIQAIKKEHPDRKPWQVLEERARSDANSS